VKEKRAYDRYDLWFPVTIEGPSRKVWAVCHDASAGGILVSGTEELMVGSMVTVSFRVTVNDAEEKSVRGRIVRVEGPNDDPRAVWPHRMAIEFLEPVSALQGLFAHASTTPPPRSSLDEEPRGNERSE
jgi:hypothetical protein